MSIEGRLRIISGTEERTEERNSCPVHAGESRDEAAIFLIWNTDVHMDNMPFNPGNEIAYPKFFLMIK